MLLARHKAQPELRTDFAPSFSGRPESRPGWRQQDAKWEFLNSHSPTDTGQHVAADIRPNKPNRKIFEERAGHSVPKPVKWLASSPANSCTSASPASLWEIECYQVRKE